MLGTWSYNARKVEIDPMHLQSAVSDKTTSTCKPTAKVRFRSRYVKIRVKVIYELYEEFAKQTYRLNGLSMFTHWNIKAALKYKQIINKKNMTFLWSWLERYMHWYIMGDVFDNLHEFGWMSQPQNYCIYVSLHVISFQHIRYITPPSLI